MPAAARRDGRRCHPGSGALVRAQEIGRRHGIRSSIRKGLAMLDVEYTDPIQFSYWAPLGSGGFVVSDIEQRTEFNFEANVRYIREAERTGFDYALMPARYFVSHGWP